MRPTSDRHEIHFTPIFWLDERPCDNVTTRYAVLWHESEAEARRDHCKNPVIAFTAVDHVPCRATVEKAAAVEFAVDAAEVGLALEIRKANRVAKCKWMTRMDDDHHLLAEQRHDMDAFVGFLAGKTVDRNLKVAFKSISTPG